MKKIALFLIAKEKFDSKKFIQYVRMIKRMKPDAISKLNVLIENPKIRKPLNAWILEINKYKPTEIDIDDFISNVKQILKLNYPTGSILSKIFDQGLILGFKNLERVLISKKVKQLFNEEKMSTEDLKTVHSDFKNHFESMEQQLFKTKNPTVDQIKKLSILNIDEFKIYQKAKRKKKEIESQLSKTVFETEQIMNVDDYRKKVKEINIDAGIDKNFKGSIDKEGNLLTTDNKLLIGKVGSKVEMNKAYKKHLDDTYYCKSTDRNGNTLFHYTEDYCKKRKKEKFAKNAEFSDSIEDLRSKINEDLESPNKLISNLALIVSLVDQGCFRIGNSASEEQGHLGLTTLRIKHVKFDDKRQEIVFNYVGKDGIHQQKLISDKKLYDKLKKMTDGKSDDDYLFAFPKKHGSEQRLNSGDVNFYMKNHLKSPVTIHKFRTFHATKLAKELLENLGAVKDEKELMDVIQTRLEKVAKKLGHTSVKTTIEHYIDTSVLQSAFHKTGFKVPKQLKFASLVGLLKFAAEEDIEVVKPKYDNLMMTESEENFAVWMKTLPEVIMDKTSIEV